MKLRNPARGYSATADQWILAQRPARNPVDAGRPFAFFIEEERAESGETASIATIFLTNRECPWHCLMCDLWKNTLTESVPPGAIPAQIDFALLRLLGPHSSISHPAPLVEKQEATPLRTPTPLVSAQRAGPIESGDARERIPKPTQIKLYNSGSFFDRRAIPPADYPAIAQRVRRFERVIVECHPSLIGDSCLRFRDSLSGRLEVAMGLETAHPEVLARLNKRMTLKQFARAAEFTRQNGIALRVFILVKPPFLDEAEALCWAKRSLDFAFECGATVATLIPTRAGNGALEALAAQGQFSPPKLETLEAAAAYGVGLGRGRVFADLWDLDKFSKCVRCYPARLARLQEMNLRQAVPPLISCPQCGAAESRADVSPAQDAGEAPFPG
jgi:uncharacterized Fe-S cluster-containing MiaB family protein